MESDLCTEGSVFMGGASVQWLRDQLKLFKNAADTEKYGLQSTAK